MGDPWKHYAKCKKSFTKRPYIVWFHLDEKFRIGKSIETESRIVVTKGWRAGCGREAANGSFCSEENILELAVQMVRQLCDYTKNDWIVHFKWVSFVIVNYNSKQL